MKKYFVLYLIALFGIQAAIAQSVGIGTASPNASARLEVKSATQGILIPTLTFVQRSEINNPATGLLVFQTDGTPGFYYYNGVVWIILISGSQPNNEGITHSPSYGLTTTFAGDGLVGADNGSSTAASFNFPSGVGVDILGNVYVADRANHKIRKIAGGVVSTLAGSGAVDSVDGIGGLASFSFPSGVAVDVTGNIYVADFGNHRIRKITPGGVVSTLAGSGTAGSIDGIGKGASFRNPTGVAVDASGNVYVADLNNHKIRKITPAGVVSTLAGSGSEDDDDGTGILASFNRPRSVAVDASGLNIYVADYRNNKIRKVTAGGVVTTLAGSPTLDDIDGTGTAAAFNGPAGVAVDAYGNIYVADLFNDKIRKVTASGVVTTLAGNGIGAALDGIGNAASFNAPSGVAVDATGHVYVADENNLKIRKIIAR